MTLNRRTEIIHLATAWVLENGLHNMSLRPLAAGLGTSARMIVYHFGTKENLIAAILELVAAQWMTVLQEQLDAGIDLDQAVERLWKETLYHPENRNIHILSLEAWAIGLSSGHAAYRPFLDTVATGWVDLADRWLSKQPHGRKHARVRATLLIAGVEGLLLHHVTDDALPVNEAFEELIAWLRSTFQESRR